MEITKPSSRINMILKKLFFVILFLISKTVLAQSDDFVWAKINEVDQLRITLAKTIPGNGVIDEALFGRVCKPVGMAAKKIAEENKWIFKQVSLKNRNEGNGVDEEAKKIYIMFENDKLLNQFKVNNTLDGISGKRYFQRIVVQDSCLNCHGNQELRPDFIKKKYLNDKAYGFKGGDLRGLYSVFVSDKK
jgi:hypothetical protein